MLSVHMYLIYIIYQTVIFQMHKTFSPFFYLVGKHWLYIAGSPPEIQSGATYATELESVTNTIKETIKKDQ